MLKYPRTSSSTSSGYYDDDEALMNPYQTPPASPQIVPQYLQRHMVRMFSTEDASGTSAVAIDNKIEQAMDLVKSHLMIAVREEVEVLKERISELMDKISNLELENNILKSNMSPETLQQLQIQLQIAGSQQPAAVAAPPATPAIQAAPTATAVTAAAAAVGAVPVSAAAATSPATAVAPVLANGSVGSVGSSTENGSSGGASVDAAVTAVDAVQSAAAAAAAANGSNSGSGIATAAVSTNGPMS